MSTRLFVAGATGTGKSHFLRHVVLPELDRCLLIDFVGEWERYRTQRAGKVKVAGSLRDVRKALGQVAGDSRWCVIAQIPPDEFPELAAALVPRSFTDETPVFARAVQGCALVCDEVDLVAKAPTPPEVLALWQRGRHAGLSVYAATQAPALVNPLVRGQSRYLVMCAMHERRSREYFAAVLPDEVAARLERLEPRHALVYDTFRHEAQELAGDRFERRAWAWRPASAPKSV